MLEQKQKVIGNHTYSVGMLGAKKSRQVWFRILGMLAPVIGAGLRPGMDVSKFVGSAGTPTAALLESLGVENLGAALEKLPQVIKEEDLDYLCESFGLVSSVRYSDGRVLPLDLENQENHFRGRLLECFRWIAFAIETNYSDFLGSLSGAATLASVAPQSEETESK